MRTLAIVLLLTTTTVYADAPGDAAIQAGTELAGQGRFKEAVVQFKAARAAAPDRAEPDCLIALAYRRLERWGQARLFLGRCMDFASRPGWPAWVEQLTTDINNGIAHGGLTQVTFAVTLATAQIELASFASDERFPLQPIFLEPGKQLVTVTAPGFTPEKLTIDVPAAGPYEVKAQLRPDTEQQPRQPSPALPPHVEASYALATAFPWVLT
jgi:hypothetical protein